MARLMARTTQLFVLELHAFSRLRLWMQGSEVRVGGSGLQLRPARLVTTQRDTQLPTEASQLNITSILYHQEDVLWGIMGDSPEEIKLLLEVERVCLKKDLGPDQENNVQNNVRDMKKFLENNNDALAANFEKKHYCDLDDVKIMTQNIERKPPEKVIFNDHHEVLRGTKILNIKQNLFVPDFKKPSIMLETRSSRPNLLHSWSTHRTGELSPHII